MGNKKEELSDEQKTLRTTSVVKLAAAEKAKPTSALSFDELMQKLHIHQVELETNNEELRRTQAALEKTRGHYVDLYDFAPVGYLTLNDEGTIQEINLTAAKLLREDRANIIGRRFAKFIADDYKDLWHRHFQLAKQADGKYGCELPFTGAEGQTLYYHLDCLFEANGEATPTTRVTLTDVTERKQAEVGLRIAAAAFEAQECMMVTDANRIILRVNDAFTRITGYSAEDAVGSTPRILRSGIHDKAFYDAVLEAVARDGYWEGEIWNKRKNGEIFPVLQTITAVTNEVGQLTHYVGAMMDISVQKQAEKVLIDARERLENKVAETQEELDAIKSETVQINTALGVLLKHRERDKTEAQISLSNEVEAIVLPLLGKLKGVSKNRLQSLRMIGMVEDNLKNLMKSYGRANHIDSVYQKLSPIERQVAGMVKLGQPTKVIAATLNITAGTVNIHRKHIRKKLSLDNKENLQGYLQSLTDSN